MSDSSPHLASQQPSLIDAMVTVLEGKSAPSKLNDLWFDLPSPRPGRIEFERLLQVRDDLFQTTVGGEVELVDKSSENLMGSHVGEGRDFAVPKPEALIGYYEGCVREDGRRVRCYSTHLGVSALPTETDWVSERKGVYSIPVTAEHRAIILNNSDSSAAHYYGYPILAQWQEEEQLMKFVPILFWKLSRLGKEQAVSHRLSFTLEADDFRFNQEVLRTLPRRERKRVTELIQNATSVTDCLELIQADFLGLQIN